MAPLGAVFDQTEFGRNYLGSDDFSDPSGGKYKLRYMYAATYSSYHHKFFETSYSRQIFIRDSHKCSSTELPSGLAGSINTGNANNYAIFYGLEGGGVVCLDS